MATTGKHISGYKLTEKGTNYWTSILHIRTYWDDAYDAIEEAIEIQYPTNWFSEGAIEVKGKHLINVLEKFLNDYVSVAKSLKRSVSNNVNSDFTFINSMTSRGMSKIDVIDLLNIYHSVKLNTSEINFAMWNPYSFYKQNPNVKKTEDATLFGSVTEEITGPLLKYAFIGGTIYALLIYGVPTLMKAKAKRGKK
jgi:hypothetical protein